MLENIISSASNESETKVLKVASSLHICTGGWAKFSDDELGTKNSLRLSNEKVDEKVDEGIDEDNLLSGDVTLLIYSKTAVANSPNRWQTLLTNSSYRSFIKADVHQEAISKGLECQRLNPSVLNIMVIEDPTQENFVDEVENFMNRFLDSIPDLYSTHADPIWFEESRRTVSRKTNFVSAWSAYIHTKDKKYIPAIEREALRDSFKLLSRLPIAPSTLSRFIDIMMKSIRNDFNKLVQRWEDSKQSKRLLHGIPTQASQRKERQEDLDQYELWLHECVTGSLIPKKIESQPPDTRCPPDVFNDVFNDLYDLYDKHNKHWDRNDMFRDLTFPDACNLLANTERRSERPLRTMGLLILGGIVSSRDRKAWDIIENARKKHERIRTSYSIDQLDLRFESIEGWSGLIKLGESIPYIIDKDRFLSIAQINPRKQVYERRELQEALFYFADAFRRDRTLWTIQAVASFAHWTAAVCGDSPERWQTWIGPPQRSAFLI